VLLELGLAHPADEAKHDGTVHVTGRAHHDGDLAAVRPALLTAQERLAQVGDRHVVDRLAR